MDKWNHEDHGTQQTYSKNAARNTTEWIRPIHIHVFVARSPAPNPIEIIWQNLKIDLHIQSNQPSVISLNTYRQRLELNPCFLHFCKNVIR